MGFGKLELLVGTQPTDVVAPPAWSFGDSPRLADELLALVLEGRKTGTSTSLAELEDAGEPVPRVGELSIVLDGAGEPQAAWDAAIAGWVRARLAGSRAASLRADLDKLVLEGIVPDLVKLAAADRREQLESELRTEWAVVKERWK